MEARQVLLADPRNDRLRLPPQHWNRNAPPTLGSEICLPKFTSRVMRNECFDFVHIYMISKSDKRFKNMSEFSSAPCCWAPPATNAIQGHPTPSKTCFYAIPALLKLSLPLSLPLPLFNSCRPRKGIRFAVHFWSQLGDSGSPRPPFTSRLQMSTHTNKLINKSTHHNNFIAFHFT